MSLRRTRYQTRLTSMSDPETDDDIDVQDDIKENTTPEVSDIKADGNDSLWTFRQSNTTSDKLKDSFTKRSAKTTWDGSSPFTPLQNVVFSMKQRLEEKLGEHNDSSFIKKLEPKLAEQNESTRRISPSLERLRGTPGIS